jgi:NAD(P)-dependent dehydrogenase (short-subunit alcohol dehydrogenase family)
VTDERGSVIVTGAGSGLGRAMTLRLLRDGFHTTLMGQDQAALDETIALAGDDSARASAMVGDVRVPDDRRRAVEHAEQQSGRLYGLVNNAGIARVDPLLDESPSTWREVIDTNLESAFFLAQAAFEKMRPHGEGRVVNIGSIYGVVGFNNKGYGARAPATTPGDRGPMRQSSYDASKAALIHLTKTLATAVGRWGITVNCVSPGSIPWANERDDQSEATPTPNAGDATRPGLGDAIDPAIIAALADQVPLGRLGRTDEIAGPVSFLLSDDASYITGMNLIVDGGFTIW